MMRTKRITLTILSSFMLLSMASVWAENFVASTAPTFLIDFFLPGSQPNGDVVYAEFVSSVTCKYCHELQPDASKTQIYAPWQGSMMAQAARDPIFYACLAIANQDAAFAGDLCLRCHTPPAWLAGRSEPTDGSALIDVDRDGVNCSTCHRMVDPVLKPGSPYPDDVILDSINPLPSSPGGGNYIMDPEDRRRGPFNDGQPAHLWLHSPFHETSELCATCHDVSNPVYERQSDDTYTLTNVEEEHPTGDKYDMFPLERTYSEWLHSTFAQGGIDMKGRFGGNKIVVGTCQDCHMPDITGQGCVFEDTPLRENLPSHVFAGGNAWVQDMILNLYPNDGLNPAYLEAGKAAAVSMLQRASTLEVTQAGNHIRTRLTNETGHKLPSGYPEGRRIWVNVEFYDSDRNLIEDRGHYDFETADLITHNTKVYEILMGIDETVSKSLNAPVGEGFHFVLNNVVLKDNRIPPRGFTNEAFTAIQSPPVHAHYADGQYWDDTRFRMPQNTARVMVKVYYQTSSKEYITFLRDENRTNDAGDVLYAQWELTGKSPPVMMASSTIDIQSFADGDANFSGMVDLLDYLWWDRCQTGPDAPYKLPICATLDFDADGDVDLFDYAEFIYLFGNE